MNELEYLKKYLHKEDNLEEAIKRLEAGEPVQYIIGDVDFYGNILKVNKNVLIPRRETEELVEKTTNYIKKYLKDNISIIDIGTGSGCIPISLKKLLPNTNITAVDISSDALEIAADNASSNNVDITFLQSDVFSNITNKYDCIISNPPYIRYDEEIMDVVKNNEPHLALFAEDNGLYFYKKIITESDKYLNDKFIIAFEIGEEQGQDIINIAKEKYPNAKVGGISPDLSDLKNVRDNFRNVSEVYGCIDILVNNAGVSESTPFTEYTEEAFDKVMDLNVKGVFNATRAASECMVARGSGVILSTSSMVSIYGQPSGIAYPASKFAVNGLTVSLARELGPKGIRVNAVAPGITETDMMKAVPKEIIEPMVAQIPLRRLGQPEDIANAFVFLASDEASYITGVVLSVDGMART